MSRNVPPTPGAEKYYDIEPANGHNIGSYTQSESLMLWLAMTSGNPTNYAVSYAYTTSYAGSVSLSGADPLKPPFAATGPVNPGYNVVTLDQSDDQYIQVNDTANLSFPLTVGASGTPFSMSAWIKCDFEALTTAGTDIALWCKYDSASSDREFFSFWDASQQRFRFVFTDSTSSSAANSVYLYSRTIPPASIRGQWIHIAFTFDGSYTLGSIYRGGRWYINGVDVTDFSVGADGATFNGMSDQGEPFYFGTYRSSGAYKKLFKGEIYDVAVWKDAELPAAAIRSLYFISQRSGIISLPSRLRLHTLDNATGSYPTVSRLGDPDRSGRYGISFNDTDTIVFERSTEASYPSVLQAETVMASGLPVATGLLAPPGSKYIDDIVASPNSNSTLVGTNAVIRKGVSDANIHFTPGEDFTPFREEFLYASEPSAFQDPFYTTGTTVTDVGLGFTSPLRSKTKIEIDLTPRVSSQTFGYVDEGSTWGAGLPDPYNPNIFPMVYFNFDNARFERIGLGLGSMLTHASGPPTLNGIRASYERSGTIGFTRGLEMLIEKPEMQCRPTTSFGFPSHSRYHATSSFLYPLSGVLDRPFLVEKMVYQFSASQGLGTEPGGAQRTYLFRKSGTAITDQTDGGDDPIGQVAISSFFILNQREPMSSSITVATNWNYNYDGAATSMQLVQQAPVMAKIPDVMQPNAEAEPITVATFRDIVTYGQMVRYQIDATNEQAIGFSLADAINELGLGRELNINGAASFTGSLVMSGTVKTSPRYDSGPAYRQAKYFTSYHNNNLYYGNTSYPGGRSGIFESNDRSYVAATAGAELSGTFYDFGDSPSGQGTSDNFSFPAFTDFDIPSPYLLKPEDSLIFGWQSPMAWDQERTTNGGTGPNMQIHPGAGTLTLYGSMVTDGHEYNDTLNQPLTSDAIHEAIGDIGPPLDQFDTEPRQQFRKGTFSNIMTGSLWGPTGDKSVPATQFSTARKVMGERSNKEWLFAAPQHSALKRRAQTFARGFFAADDSEKFFDSFLPDPGEIHRTDGKQLLYFSPIGERYYLMLVGSRDYNGATTNSVNNVWPRAFPFEPRYAQLKRVRIGFKGQQLVDPNTWPGTPANTHRLSVPTAMGSYDGRWGTNFRMLSYSSPDGIRLRPINSSNYTLVATWFFGVGRGYGVSPAYYRGPLSGTVQMEGSGFDGKANMEVAGFKYGVYHTLQLHPGCVFRNSRFGQFRDMLEQRPLSRFITSLRGQSTATAAPVQARFVNSVGTAVTPADTTCSNLNHSMTSSLPYFDGTVRNRGPLPVASLLNVSIVPAI